MVAPQCMRLGPQHHQRQQQCGRCKQLWLWPLCRHLHPHKLGGRHPPAAADGPGSNRSSEVPGTGSSSSSRFRYPPAGHCPAASLPHACRRAPAAAFSNNGAAAAAAAGGDAAHRLGKAAARAAHGAGMQAGRGCCRAISRAGAGGWRRAEQQSSLAGCVSGHTCRGGCCG